MSVNKQGCITAKGFMQKLLWELMSQKFFQFLKSTAEKWWHYTESLTVASIVGKKMTKIKNITFDSVVFT